MTTRKPMDIDRLAGEKIRKIRTDMGISQETLAKSVGVTFQQIQKYEKGTNRISFSRVVSIAKALHVDVSDLVPDELPEAPIETKNFHVFLTSEILSTHAVQAKDKEHAIALVKNKQMGTMIFCDTVKEKWAQVVVQEV